MSWPQAAEYNMIQTNKQRPEIERAMYFAGYMYTSLGDWTNTRRLNWTELLSFLSVALWLYEVTGQFPELW
jgi:hypothetical protein